MQQFKSLENKKVGIFGLGVSGAITATTLIKAGVDVIIWDENHKSRESISSKIDPALFCDIGGKRWLEVDTLILSPGIPLNHPALQKIVMLSKQSHREIICDIELFVREKAKQAIFIGITGTNGKSTTTALMNHILESCGKTSEVGGNIGKPIMGLWDSNAEYYCVELSSYQLDLIKASRFNVAILLNVTPDHIERHGSFEQYTETKERIFLNQHPGDIKIIGVDNKNSNAIYNKMVATLERAIAISSSQILQRGVCVLDGMIYASGKKYQLGELEYLRGEHNAENIAACFACAISVGLKAEEVIEAIKTFRGLPHRMQYLGEIAGVKYINDSKATNAEAAVKSLASFNNIHWIVGGRAKGDDLSTISPFTSKIKRAYLIGESIGLFRDLLNGKVDMSESGFLKVAFKEAVGNAVPGDVILLSPACSSYDQWKNFEQRGEAFTNLYSKEI
jgi:UDP-N-acetylmuramoylalanine--D-glutamate ligase